jgi:hypothetical protein
MGLLNIRRTSKGGFYLAMVMVLFISTMSIKPAAATPLAKSAPLFCSDVTHFPALLLTGCDLDARRLATTIAEYALPEALPGDSRVVDALIDAKPLNPLVQVGRHGLIDEQTEENEADENRQILGTEEDNSGQVHNIPQDSFSNGIVTEDQWHYMDVDQDGTLLFFGELDPMEDWSAFSEPDLVLPKDIGIGIGKRWRF